MADLYHYRHAVIGGTFDHLHSGHEALIDTALSKADHVTIGISTSPLYAHKEFAKTIESYAIREKNLTTYLKKNHFLSRTTIVSITDIYGPTLTDASIDVIVVTRDNMTAVTQINQKRKEKDLPPLAVTVIPNIIATDGKIVSSVRIRQGEVDRQGNAYLQLFKRKKPLLLPDTLRETLGEPLGEVVANLEELHKLIGDAHPLIAVGDVISESLVAAGHPAGVSIIDFKTRRHPTQTLLPLHIKRYKNKHGTIAHRSVVAYQDAITRYLSDNIPQTVVIDGEEDLLALPAILLAPLGAVVVYGQYDLGIVVNKVSESLKERVYTLVQEFQ